MNRRFYTVAALCGAILWFSGSFATGAVRINEFMASTSDRLLRWDDEGRAWIGSGVHWSSTEFDDSAWSEGDAPFGFPGQTTDLADAMQNITPSVYLRRAFTVSPADAARTDALILELDYADGVIVYLNGREMLRRNCGSTGAYMYRDQLSHNTYSSPGPETNDLGQSDGWLVAGDNVLAVQVHNDTITDDTLRCDAGLRISGGPVLLDTEGTWHYHVGVFEPSGGVVDPGLLGAVMPPVNWGLIDFDDRGWHVGPGGIGFGDGDDATDVEALVMGKAMSVYMRQAFVASVADAGSTNLLQLDVDHDDGFVAYLNGYEVARRGLGVSGDFVPYDAGASSHEAGTPETIFLRPASEILRPGTNVFAVQVHNVSLTSSDMTLIADLYLRAASPVQLVRHEDAWRYAVGTEEPADPPDAGMTDDVDSEFVDWLEIANDGPTNVSLAGWSLTDEEDELQKWAFPAVVLASGEHLLVYCSGRDMRDAHNRRFHTSFELDRGGEFLALCDPSGTPVTAFSPEYPHQDCFYSYGWDAAAGRYRYFRTATPGVANADDGFDALPTTPEFALPSGIYPGTVLLNITAEPAGVEIRYTVDGTLPTLQSEQLSPRSRVSRTTAVTARAFNAEGIGSHAVTRLYLINEPQAVTALPIVSMIGDPGYCLFKPHGVTSIVGGQYVDYLWEGVGPGDYNNVQYRGRAYEREGALAIIHSTNLVAEGSCGIRMAGSNYMRPRYKLRYLDGLWDGSTADYRPMFNITFRSLYGKDHLDGQVVPLSPKTDLYSMRLRGGHNDPTNPFLRDEMSRRSLHEAGRVCAVGMMASLYVNGVFKGYYNPCERYTAEFFQRRYDSNHDWDVITHGTGGYRLNEGSDEAWLALRTFVDSTDCSVLANYQELERMIDPAACIDYWLVNIYAGTWDWGGNNWTAARERTPQGRFQYYTWDSEGAFRGNRLDHNSITSELLYKTTYMGRIFTAAYASDEFKRLFKDRAWRIFNEDGALTDANIQRRFVELADVLDPIMYHVRGHYVSRGDIQGFIDGRRPIVLQQLRDAGLYEDVAAPTISPGGGDVTNGTLVTITHPESGSLYYALDGADPRAPGGGVAGTLYDGPIAIDRSRHVTARHIDRSGDWGPPSEATFRSTAPPIVISEIMYHPAAPLTGPYVDEDFEFVELFNAGSSPLVLTGYRFTSGLDFDFGLGDVQVLGAGEYAVVVANLAAFATRYDTNGLLIAGEYVGQLGNGGETVELSHDHFGRIIKFAYKDGWYEHTDGEGFSLTVRQPDAVGVPDDKTTWRASSLANGSPGMADEDLVPEPGSVLLNEMLTHTDASPVGDWVELHNRTAEPIDVGGWTLSDSAADLLKYTIPAGTVLPAYGYLAFSASNHFARAGSPKPFSLSEHGESVYLTSGTNTQGVMTGYRQEVELQASDREVTMGLHWRRDGMLDMTPLVAPTQGASNALPLVGPVVISEIMYHPVSNGIEFVELYNISGEAVDLFDPEHPTNTWRLAEGLSYSLPQGVTLPAYTSLVVCATSPAAFRLAHGLDAGVTVYGPYEGALANEGDDVRLYRPGNPDLDGLPWIPVDRVAYNDKAPWPVEADGLGSSLQRLVQAEYGNDPYNWIAGPLNGSPGTDVNIDSDGDGMPDVWEAIYALNPTAAGDALLDPDGDGRTTVEEYVLGTDPCNPASAFELRVDPPSARGAAVRFLALGAAGAGYAQRTRFYVLEQTDDLLRVPFAPMTGHEPIVGAGQWVVFTNAVPSRRVFYRGRVWLEAE